MIYAGYAEIAWEFGQKTKTKARLANGNTLAPLSEFPSFPHNSYTINNGNRESRTRI
jgi:hypothetical protein